MGTRFQVIMMFYVYIIIQLNSQSLKFIKYCQLQIAMHTFVTATTQTGNIKTKAICFVIT